MRHWNDMDKVSYGLGPRKLQSTTQMPGRPIAIAWHDCRQNALRTACVWYVKIPRTDVMVAYMSGIQSNAFKEYTHGAFFHRNFGWIRLQESEWVILRLAFLHKVQHTLVSCRCWERLLIDCQAAKNEQNREFFCAPFNLASVHVILPLKSGRSESVFRSVKMS